MSNENLWGNLSIDTQIEPPASILKKQAVFLSKQTKGLLVGRVTITPINGQFVVEFRVVVPALGNYAVTLLRLTHGPKMYPAAIEQIEEKTSKLKVPNETALKNLLKAIFRGSSVQNLLSALISQARSAATPNATA